VEASRSARGGIRYGADAECLYLVRPDKYVGFRAQPAEQDSLEDYLRRIFLPS
jgi:hypothetical protein